MKQLKILLIFLCASQLVTSTEISTDYANVQGNPELFQKIKQFRIWFEEHDRQFPKHSCFKQVRHNMFGCDYGIFLWASIVGEKFIPSSKNLNVCNLSFFKIQTDLGVPPKTRKNFGEHWSEVSQESTNTSTKTDDGSGYFVENQKLEPMPFQEFNIQTECFDDENVQIEEPDKKLEPMPFQEFNNETACFDDENVLKKEFGEHFEEIEKQTKPVHFEEKEQIIVLIEPELPKVNRLKPAMRQISVSEKKYVKTNEIKKKRGRKVNKKKPYKVTINEFGNQREIKRWLPYLARRCFLKRIKQTMENIKDILNGVNSLKPAEIKYNLEEFNFQGKINYKKKAQMLKNLVTLLTEKSKKLEQEQAQVIEQDLIEKDRLEENSCQLERGNSLENESNWTGSTENEPKKVSELQKVQMYANELLKPRSELVEKRLEWVKKDVVEIRHEFQQRKDSIKTHLENDGRKDAMESATKSQKKLQEICDGSKMKNDGAKNLPDTESLENSVLVQKTMGLPIAWTHFGKDVFLTEDGYLMHAPKESEKTFFALDKAINYFHFRGKGYVMDEIEGNTIVYTSEDNGGAELKFIFFYEGKHHVKIHNCDMIEVGGTPSVSVMEKKPNGWEKWKNVPQEEMFPMEQYWYREDRQKLYQKRKMIPKFQQFWQPDEMENEDISRPIFLPLNFGKDMFLTQDGFFVHAPRSGLKTLFNIEQNVKQFEFNERIFEISKFYGNKILYEPDMPESEEPQFILSYEKYRKRIIPFIGEVVEVRGEPSIAKFVKIMGKCECANLSLEKLENKLYYWREEKKETYQKWKPIPLQKFY